MSRTAADRGSRHTLHRTRRSQHGLQIESERHGSRSRSWPPSKRAVREFTEQSEVTLGSVARDRRALDSVVMGDLLGLSGEIQEEVSREVVGLVDDRLTKAAGGR
jgi:hypothetical protein